MKKKILFITPSLCQGGLEHSLVTMLKLLDENKYEMYLYTYSDDLSLLPMIPDYVTVKNDLLNKHYNRNIKALFLLSAEKVLKILKTKKSAVYAEKRKAFIHDQRINQIKKAYPNCLFDVVIANSIGKTTEMAAVVKAKKRYVFFHSSLDLHHELLVQLLPEFDKIVAVNQGVKDMLCSSYNDIEEKVYVIENYIDAEKIIRKSEKQILEDSFSKYSNVIIGTCGRISKEKGFDLAVNAAEYLKNQNVSFHWLFIGDGSERPTIECKIKEKGLSNYITITGYKDNPFPYMRKCVIYVQPSYEEAQPLVLLEAMALGKPIVSTKTVGGKIILQDGQKGILTEFTGESLAEGILSLINNPKKLHSFENLYTLEENEKEKQIYIEKINEILSD